ncbi:hypothetical protein LEP1GSC168_1024 [Leptospira santarosai str. HAI134]|uniref:Uncharacterized protein n=1 Tax=Leptospira santarosai str. MOR084 TaxID=1049984 RepID=A0A0E2BEX2_9LEPT|nr:hypothetical protein LEP1GSC179_2108 [Leptospira santarosai str. MOR084]EKR90545.1 hypothetical protein LEP1GSC163_1719 [Leptospira santarosai str. CBC379]EMO23406.1 hypothetical protein LEP1GSC168_1024 [Leptospira santarosai str. HAI134]
MKTQHKRNYVQTIQVESRNIVFIELPSKKHRIKIFPRLISFFP